MILTMMIAAATAAAPTPAPMLGVWSLGETKNCAAGPAWVFLISAEAIAADVGLGYRIFLVRRYMAMDVILPYVAWITLLAWAMDLSLRRLTQLLFPWYEGAKA